MFTNVQLAQDSVLEDFVTYYKKIELQGQDVW